MEQRPLHKDVVWPELPMIMSAQPALDSRSKQEVPPEKPSAPAAVVKLVCEHLSCFYGANKAVHSVSIGIREHRTTALIGPSGCGKSTFLRRAEPNE